MYRQMERTFDNDINSAIWTRCLGSSSSIFLLPQFASIIMPISAATDDTFLLRLEKRRLIFLIPSLVIALTGIILMIEDSTLGCGSNDSLLTLNNFSIAKQ